MFPLFPVLVSILPSPKEQKRKERNRNRHNQLSGNLIQIFANSVKQSFQDLCSIDWSQYGDIFVYKLIVGFAMGVYYSIYAAFLKETFILTPKYVGYIISFQGTVGALTSYFIGYINKFYIYDVDYSEQNFHVFLLLTSALLGLTFCKNVIAYTFCLIPLAVGNAMGRLTTLEMVLNRSHGKHRGKLIGASNSVRSLSGVVSPMVAGVIGQWVGVGYVIYASLLATALGLIFSYANRQNRLKSD